MLLYILLTVWIYGLMLLGLRKDATISALAWPQKTTSVVANQNYRISVYLANFSMLILWFLTAFRSQNIGNDTATYIYYFNIFSSQDLKSTETFEIAYRYLNVLIGKITSNPHFFLIMIATLMYGGIALYIKKYSRNALLSLCLFFSCFFSSYTSMFRQGIAMILALYGYQQIKKKHNILAIMLIAVAFLFHNTAIVVLLLFFYNWIPVKKSYIYIITLISFVISQTGLLRELTAIFFPKYLGYFSGKYASTGWLAVAYEVLRNFILFFLIFKASLGNIKKGRLDIMNCVLLLVLSIFGFSVNLFTRASQYFLLIAIMELPNILYCGRINYKRNWLWGVCTMLIIMFILVLVYRPGWNHLYPYEFWNN